MSNPRKRRSIQAEVAPKLEQRVEDQRMLFDLSKKLDGMHFTRNPDETQAKRGIIPDTQKYPNEDAFWKAKYEEECKKTEFLSKKKDEWKLFVKLLTDVRQESKQK